MAAHDRPIPGTTLFDGRQAQKGYALNKMCFSFNHADNRKAFQADEEAYMRSFGLNDDQAWAVRKRDVLGLLAAGDTRSESVQKGVLYLLENQRPDGTWDEDQYTGTGFPKVFYLKYHMYRLYFPLTALARYTRLTASQAS